MARRKAERPAERGARRAETNAVAAYLTALRAPKVPARSRDALEKRRAQIEQWIAIAIVLGVIGVVIVSDAFEDLDDDLTCLDEADTSAEIDACNE
jgi:glutathione S-transferase